MKKLLEQLTNVGPEHPGDIPIAGGKHAVKVTPEARDQFYQAARDAY